MLAGGKCPHLGHSELSSRSVPVCDNKTFIKQFWAVKLFSTEISGDKQKFFPVPRMSPIHGRQPMPWSSSNGNLWVSKDLWAPIHLHIKTMMVLPFQALTIMKQTVNLKSGFLLNKGGIPVVMFSDLELATHNLHSLCAILKCSCYCNVRHWGYHKYCDGVVMLQFTWSDTWTKQQTDLLGCIPKRWVCLSNASLHMPGVVSSKWFLQGSVRKERWRCNRNRRSSPQDAMTH